MFLNENLFEDSAQDSKMINMDDRFKFIKEYPTYNYDHQKYFTRPCKYYDLDLTPDQADNFFKFLEDGELNNFWIENAELSDNIYQAGRMGGHLILDDDNARPNDYSDFETFDDVIEAEKDAYAYYSDEPLTDSEEQEAIESARDKVNLTYNTLIDFDHRVDQLIDLLKQSIDGYVDPNELDDIEESLYQANSASGNKMTFEVTDDGRLIVKDGEKITLDTKVEDPQSVKDQISNLNNIEIVKENITEQLDNEVAKEIDFVFASDDQGFAYKMLNRLQSDCKYILGALKDNSPDGKVSLESINKFLWFNDIDKQIAFMKGIYDRLDEKPEWISLEDINNYEKALKEIVRIEESLKEELTPEKEIEYALITMINALIKDELEAIDGYNSAIVTLEAENKGEFTDIIRDIISEENVHVGQLQAILKELNPQTTEDIKDGQEEGEEQIDQALGIIKDENEEIRTTIDTESGEIKTFKLDTVEKVDESLAPNITSDKASDLYDKYIDCMSILQGN